MVFDRLAWDVAPHGLGKLARTESPDEIVVEYAYDSWSRTIAETVQFGLGPDPEQFITRLSYDSLGRPEVVTYPQAPDRPLFEVKSAYNDYGYLFQRSDASDPSVVYWTVTGRELDGALQTQLQADDLETAIARSSVTGRIGQYCDSRQRRPRTCAVLRVHVLRRRRHQDANRCGGLSARAVRVRRPRAARVLDALFNQPAFSTRSTEHDYNLIGNLTTVKVNGAVVDQATFTDPVRPHAMTSLNGQTFAYDARGRQDATSARTVAYSAFDLPRTMGVTPSLSSREGFARAAWIA